MTLADRTPRRLLPRIADVIFAAVFLTALWSGNRMINVDGDLGRHLTLGNTILMNGKIPLQDVFSHTMPGAELVPHEWLSQVLLALAYKAGKFGGVVFLTAAALAVTFTLLFKQSLCRSRMPAAAAALALLAVAATSFHWLTRPHIFSYLMVVIWMGILAAVRENRRRAWLWMPAAMLVWVNLHGGFITGFALWGCYVLAGGIGWAWSKKAGRQYDFPWQGMLAGGLSAALASLANPAGWRIWELSLGFLQNRYLTGHTWEYLPPDLRLPLFWPFLIVMVAGVAMAAILKFRIPMEELFIFAGFGLLAFLSARLVPIFTLAFVPLAAGWYARILRKPGLDSALLRLEDRIQMLETGAGLPLVPAALLVLAFIWGWASLPNPVGRLMQYGFSAGRFPVQAQAWLQQNPLTGNVFNYFPWGGYLLFENWPDQKVFIDGQTDFYGEALTRDYETILTAGDGWQELLSRYQVKWVILPPDEPLVQALLKTEGWITRYQDGTAVILAYDP